MSASGNENEDLIIIDDKFEIIYIYLLWNSNPDDEWKIQGVFGKNLEYDFQIIDEFPDSKLNTFIYQLEYKCPLIHESINTKLLYQIKFSKKTNNDYKLYDESKQRILDTKEPYQFVCDIRTSSSSSSTKGLQPIDFWNQLCFYTYFLIKKQMYNHFQYFRRQFLDVYKTDQTFKLTSPIFKQVSHVLYMYLPQINSRLKTNSTAIQIYFQLFSLLPLDRTNLEYQNSSFDSLASELYDSIKSQLEYLLQSLNLEDWFQFSQGLTVFMSAQILRNSTIFNTSNLLHQMKIYPEKQSSTVNILFRRLIDLKLPIENNSWMDLFSLITDKHLLFDCLNLVSTLDDYLTVLQYVIRENQINEKMKLDLTDNFERLVNRTDFNISIENILKLLNHLQPDNRTSLGLTNEQLNTFQVIIKSSTFIRQKIHSYFDQIDSNRISLENFYELFQLDQFVSLLDIDKSKFLIKILTNHQNRTETFYMNWFIYFLCEKSSENNRFDPSKFVDLVKHWLDSFQRNSQIFLHILSNIDKLIDHLQNVIINENLDQRVSLFIQTFLTACFPAQKKNFKYLYQILHVICIHVKNSTFLHLYEKQFIDDLLAKNETKLKLMDDETNPFNYFLKLNQEIHTKTNSLLTNLIIACTKMIRLNKDEILYEAFVNPTKQSLTYTILFEKQLNKSFLQQQILQKLNEIWSKWMHTGLKLSEIDVWKRYSDDQYLIFKKLWDKVQNFQNEQQSIETIFQNAENDYYRKESMYQSLKSTLYYYCDKAIDYSRAMESLRDMLNKLREQPIQQVDIPKELTKIESIAVDLQPFLSSEIWSNYYTRNSLSESKPIETTHALLKATTSAALFEFSSDDDDSSSPRSTSTSLPINGKSRTNSFIVRNSNEHITCIQILKNVYKIFEDFREHIRHLAYDWEKETISEWIQLISDYSKVSIEFELIKTHWKLEISEKIVHIFNFWKDKDMIHHISHGCLKFIRMFELNFEANQLDLFNNLIHIDEHTFGDRCSNAYEEYQTKCLSRYSSNTLIILSQFDKASELIDFLVSISSNDIDNLLENVNDGTAKLVGTKTVRDFQILKYYFDQLYKSIEQLRQKTNLFDVLSCLDQIPFHTQIEDLQQFFANCSIELSIMKQSYAELIDKEQTKRRLIGNLMRKSLIKFIQLKKTFDIDVFPYEIDFSDLSELRDRARLIEYSSTEKKVSIEQFHMFIQLVNRIENILQLLNLLDLAGHSIVKIILDNHREFPCENNQFDDLIEFHTELEDISLSWKKTLCEKYIKYPELTYFTWKQFDMIERFLSQQNNSDEREEGYHLLKYIGIEPRILRRYEHENRTPEERLEYFGSLLSEQRIQTRCTISHQSLNRKIFLVETTERKLLRGILSLYQRFDQHPSVNHLFYCTNETNWIEIRAFIYRSFFSQEFYQLIQPEVLSIIIHDQMIDLIRQLIEEYPQQLFSMAFILTKQAVQLQLIDGLKSLQIIQIINEQEFINDLEFRKMTSKLIKKCLILTSSITGLGKSYTIREECRRTGREYIKFPINGEVQPDLIAERLLQYAHKFPTSAIHFDLGVIDNYHQLNDLISCLVLFRSFCFGQKAIFLPDKTPIYIELDSSSHSNLFENIDIFHYIRVELINHIDWKKFQLTEQVQFVANYLKAINNRTIIRKDILKDNLEYLNVDECTRLLHLYFFPSENDKNISWTKVFIYISIFDKLFDGFSKCGYFLSALLGNDKLRQLRMDILQSFLRSARQFTTVSVENVREQQRSIKTRTDQRQSQKFSDAIIRWDKIEPFTLIFTPTFEPIFVYKTEQNIPPSLKSYFDVYNQKAQSKGFSLNLNLFSSKASKTIFPDYQKLEHEQLFEKLTELSSKYSTKAICRECFRAYDPEVSYTCTKCSDNPILLERPDLIAKNSNDLFKNHMAKLIKTTYVITPDNYIKMLLVFLRVQSSVPVLIMGETGCGKTALITCLCRKILDDELHVFRLHAGITNEILINEMTKLITQAENLPSDKRLWVFFDEFNTIFNISLLKEILCERTLLGRTLPTNMVFLGTCNPQREKPFQSVFQSNVGIKKDRYDLLKLQQHHQTLFYTVTPIPETMLEYVWDYGHLDSETEKTYIRATLNTYGGFAKHQDLLEITIGLVSESHQFLRHLEDVSSVSLRDVVRFGRLFQWFNEYLRSNQVEEQRIGKYSSRLALLLCYYFRLETKEQKEKYLERLDHYLCQKYPHREQSTFSGSFKRLLNREQMRLIEQMEIPSDMASNQALKDNLFVLFACIMNRIPVFLCGKPGASKTSAVQILMNNFKGSRSNSCLFRKYPELVAVTFQGTQTCTSKSIEQIFQRADKFIRIESHSQLLPVIIFDEIGLAESSIHNPLKVLHGHLEIEECRFGFVGISNWRLDASKMNRALYIACLDPDDEDLYFTGKFLVEKNSKNNEENRFDLNIIRGLAHAYGDLQKVMIKKYQLENYFGLRDYYSLIKGIVADDQKYPQQSRFEIIYKQLVMNFGGIYPGYEYMWEKFCSLLDRYKELRNAYTLPSPKELIQQCLINRNNRHLMLIVDRESTIDHVERYLTANLNTNNSVKTLVGSRFEGDFVSKGTYTESYSTRVLMEIILHAETPITLVMRHMDHLHDNLYDLFNQNFAITGRKKYCRIALSSIYNPRCLIHDQFYCIILLNKKDVDTSDPPFLNRFQKYFIETNKLIETRQIDLTIKLSDWLVDLMSFKDVNQDFLVLKHFIPPYSSDFLCGLVSDVSENDNLTDEQIFDLCQEKLIRTCSFDLPLFLSLNGANSLINKYYQIHNEFVNIHQLISSTFQQQTSTKKIIYTYTPIYDIIEYENVEQIKLSNIKTELELINRLKSFNFKQISNSLLVIHIDYHREQQHILSLKYNILNQWIDFQSSHLWLIFHIQRNKLSQTHDEVLFPFWDILMIENLNQTQSLISQDILLNPSYQYFLDKSNKSLVETNFNEFLHRTISKCRYENLSNDEQTERYNRLFDILNHETDHYFRQILLQTIDYFIRTIANPHNERFQDWRKDLLTNNQISLTSRSFDEVLQTHLSLFYESYFHLLIHHFEIFNLIDSYFYLTTHSLKDFWTKSYRLSLNTIDTTIMNFNILEINFLNHLRLPFSLKEYQIIEQLRKKTDEDLSSNIIHLLKETSSYGDELIEMILSNEQLLNAYYYDQLILFHRKNHFQFSTDLTFQLLTTNTKRTTLDRLIELLIYSDEFIEILHIVEDSLKFFDETIFFTKLKEQITTKDSLEKTTKSMYSIVYQDDKYHIISPHSKQIDSNVPYDPDIDPFIQITLMNLIEEILSPKLISNCLDIELLITRFSSINQRCLNLQIYRVNNLEKLCSVMSLLRCIQTIIPSQTIEIYQKIYVHFQIETCEDIHRFISILEKILLNERAREYNQSEIRSILLKLEVEFLKTCLEKYPDQCWNLLKIINQKENHLWKYSSKIFFNLVNRFKLAENIESSYEQFDNDDIEQFNQYLKSHLNIQRLLTDRLYLDLTLQNEISANFIKFYLNKYFYLFEERIEFLNTFHTNTCSYIEFIRCLAWLKYYSQLYSISLQQYIKYSNADKFDQYLTNNFTSFSSTIKLYILKQTLFFSNMNINELEKTFINRNIKWLDEFYQKSHEENLSNSFRFLYPIPFSSAEDEYNQVNRILTDFIDIESIDNLIVSCSTNHYLAYCFYLWFIKYYIQYSKKQPMINEEYKNFFEKTLSKESKVILQPIGIVFLQNLCSNFTLNSYFHLDSSTTNRDISIRLVILNIFALTLAYKSLPQPNWLNTILFENNAHSPENYFQYFQKICFFGFLNHDPIRTNMKYVRATVKHRTNAGQIPAAGQYIYQCSKDCLYLIHFTHCGVPNQNSKCPFCQKDIGASKYGELIQREPPQIKMTIDEGLKMIDDYLDKTNYETKFSYYEVVSSKQSNLEDKSDHLKTPISFRFLHFFLHSILFLLQEFKYLTNENLQQWNISSQFYFQNHIEKDYSLLEKCLSAPQDCYIYIFQLLNHMLIDFDKSYGSLNSKEKVIDFEKSIDETLFDPNRTSKMDEIIQYKQKYAEYTEKEQMNNTLTNFLDERIENTRRYPYLNFFNTTKNFQEQDHLDEFFHHLQALPDGRTNYPLTMFILERIEIFSNIRYISSIIEFINYLREKFNYRISRQNAIGKSIRECLDGKGKDLYEKFKKTWMEIQLKEVRYGCQIRKFDEYKTNEEKRLAFFSLNISKDDSSLILAATLETLSKFQNEIVNYFHHEILQSPVNLRTVPINSITENDLFQFNKQSLNEKIQEHAIVINFEYGQSQELIYDFEEIEMTLRSMINRLPLINTENFRKIHYQFELYSENNTLINYVRQHVQQEQIPDEQRRQYLCQLNETDINDILQYLGSLDLIFTYLQNRNYRSSISTIDLFVKEYIHSKQFLHQNIFLQTKFNQLKLQYIIDFYELIEEIAFDKIFRNLIIKKLHDPTIDHQQQTVLQERFLFLTIDNETIAPNLRDIHQWIGTLKRFMVRILPDYIDLNSSIEIYLKRTDLWNCRISGKDIETIHIDESILLKHTMIILNGLENRSNELNGQHEELLINSDSVARTEDEDLLSSFKRKPKKSIGKKK